MSLSAALATASRALQVFSSAVQVSSHNISNSSTEGYVREELKLQPTAPYVRGDLIVGSGVRSTAIKQVIDQFLEHRLHDASSDAEAARAREQIYTQLEVELRELGDSDLSTGLNDFVASINEVVNQPESAPLRANAVEEGRLLAEHISNLRQRLDGLRTSQTARVDSLVNEANGLIDEVQSLNRQISNLETNGLHSSDAGGLRTQRYDALNRLAQIIPVTYREQPNGVVDIYSGSEQVLYAGLKQRLETDSYQDRGILVQTVRFSESNTEISGGELQGVFEGRDQVLGGFIDELDSIAGGLIFEFNRLHSSGEGVDGHTALTGTESIDDPNSVLNAGGLAFTPQHGSFEVRVVNRLTGNKTIETIQVDLDGIGGDDTTFEDLRASLDAVGNVSASFANGRLNLQADANFEIRFGDDSSGVLAALGINTFFTGSDSRSIGINDTIASNQNLFAAGQGGGPGDNRNALLLAQVLDQPVTSLGGISLISAYESAITGVAQGAAAEQATAQGLVTFRQSLLSQREQFSGVSLDEEAVRLIEFQQAFAASARIIQTVDELFQTLVSL